MRAKAPGCLEKEKRGSCVCCEALSLFFFKPGTHVLLKGALPRRREGGSWTGTGVLHEKQPICEKMLLENKCGVPASPFSA